MCPNCEGLLEINQTTDDLGRGDLRTIWLSRRASFAGRDRSGVWRFRELLPFDDDTAVISLQEGNTPLYDAPRSADYCKLDALRLKHQGCNPTGSFKDTGMTTAVTQAKRLGAEVVVCASTGNTAASVAAYASRADLVCAIMVPAGQVSHAKLAQALDYGAKVFEIEGNFDSCMRLMRELAEDKSVYLVNSINPFRIEGQKTVAAELCEQLDWQVPDHLIVPGGNLGNSSALGKGFQELLALRLIDRLPHITVVQAEGAAPFARLFEQAGNEMSQDDVSLTFRPEAQPQTLASAIKIGAPVSWKKAWRVVRESDGSVITVSEQEIADAKAVIGRDGVGCEPASATTVAGIRNMVAGGIIKSSAAVVAVLTGHVLKDTDYVIKYHNCALRHPRDGQLMEGQFTNQPSKVAGSPDVVIDLIKRMKH